ncbi:MAG: hypothetical protein C0408_09310 [Odoribacter sp.]|nr:hypothetical protein [Odoribacter sp.]
MASPTTTTTYTVTVSSGTCIPATDAVTVIVKPLPVAMISGDTLICSGTSTTLTASGGTTYLWSTGATTTSVTVNPSLPSTYTVTATTNGCTDIAVININILATEQVNAYPDTTITAGTTVQLHADGGVSWNWTPAWGLSCSNCQDPVAAPETTSVYTVTAIDSNGCVSSDQVIITIDMNCGDVFIPNAFSPNADGINDTLYVRGNCIKTMDFALYDRWGEKVFSSSGKEDGWDGNYRGKPMGTGVYYYYLKATLYDGTEVKRKGSVTLMR